MNIDDDEMIEQVLPNKKWSHDIKKIGDEYVEEVVLRYQLLHDPVDHALVVKNYSIFRIKPWGIAFSQYMHKDVEAGAHLHDEIVWFAMNNFKTKAKKKPNGRAFNAYLVSCLMNQLKNFRNVSLSSKSRPRIICHVCGQKVADIDKKHLEHRVDLKHYRKSFPGHSVVSTDGLVYCPETKVYATKIDDRCLAGEVVGGPGIRCPVTGMVTDSLPACYPGVLLEGYDLKQLSKDFPRWNKLSTTPESFGLRHAEYLSYLKGWKRPRRRRAKITSMTEFGMAYPGITTEARQVDVENPYSGKKVREITMEMLDKAGVTLQQHMHKYSTIWLDMDYQYPVKCPFTGRRAHAMRTKDLAKIGRTTMEFYMATCKYPLRQFQVKCAICGRWVDNIWDHLEQSAHFYAETYSMEGFEQAFGFGKTKLSVSTNAYVEGDSGESVFIADLLPGLSLSENARFEIEDSLSFAAKDELDKQIARAAPDCLSLEDLYHMFCRRMRTEGRAPNRMRRFVVDKIGTDDFDIEYPKSADGFVNIIAPRKVTIRQKLESLIQNSDLVDESSRSIQRRCDTEGQCPEGAGLPEEANGCHAVAPKGKGFLQG